MDLINLSILIFIILESSNVIILYFFPDSKLGNGVAVFNNYHLIKKDEDNYLFAKYLINWVAGTKLIFITLLAVILFLGSEILKVWALVVLIFSIVTYFFRLHVIISKLDKKNMITPKNYSKALLAMIISFIIMFTIPLILYLI
ncbi:MAG: hypothetical protein R3Y21_05090 [Mycoplasmatota bacterium]